MENENSNASAEDAAKRARVERIKRMRGWMGVKGVTIPGGHPDDGGSVSYGDGHSGWNR